MSSTQIGMADMPDPSATNMTADPSITAMMANPSASAMMAAMMTANSIRPMEGLVNPVSMAGMAIAFLVLGISLTTIRFFTRRMQRLEIGWDDWLIIPAMVLMLAMSVNMISGVAMERLGYMLPLRKDPDGMPDVPYGYAPEVAQANMFEFVQEILAPLQLMFTKLSILLFYRRVLLPRNNGAFHWISLVTVCTVILWGATLTTAFIFPCGSRWYLYWDGPLAEASQVCATDTLEAALILTDVFLDVVIFILPIPKIFKLQLSLRKKLLVSGAFLLGALTVVAAVVRLVFVAQLISGAEASSVGELNEGSEISLILYWGMLESGLSIIVSCLPALQYLFTRSGPMQLARHMASSLRSVSQLSFRRSTNDLEKGHIRHLGLSSLASSVGSSGARSPRTPVGPFTPRTPRTPRTPATPGSYVHRHAHDDTDLESLADIERKEQRANEMF